ncbi:MAG: hypothetical protein U0S12_01340 [Fimbriimonadales bacterium]
MKRWIAYVGIAFIVLAASPFGSTPPKDGGASLDAKLRNEPKLRLIASKPRRVAMKPAAP